MGRKCPLCGDEVSENNFKHMNTIWNSKIGHASHAVWHFGKREKSLKASNGNGVVTLIGFRVEGQ